MRPYVIFTSKRSELSTLTSVMEFLMKKRGELQNPQYIQKFEQLRVCLEDPSQLKMLVCDITVEGTLPVVESVRRSNADMRLILVADQTVPPVVYIRPTVLPTALLWRPFQTEEVAKTLWEVLRGIPKEHGDETGANQADFHVEIRGEVRCIAYDRISFFEARNKRLYLHTGRTEMAFSGTLEKLIEDLPEEFMRVHKSFIINRSCISEVHFGQNTVTLDGNIEIPISRSYKSTLKAVFA